MAPRAHTQQGVNWRALFARRGFRYFFTGMFISLFGSGMNFAGVTWYILAKTNSTVDVSVMLVLLTLPGLIVPFAGGVLIDRVDRRYLAMALDLSRLCSVGGTAAMLAFGNAGLFAIYCMVLFNGFCGAIYWATVNALVHEVVPADELVGANSSVIIAVQAGVMLAGALVGYTYDRVGIAGILAIDAATYGVSALCLLRLRRGYHSPRAAHMEHVSAGLDAPLAVAEETALPPLVEALPEPGFLHDLKSGWTYLRGQPAVLAMGFTYACMIGGVISANVIVVALAKDILHSGARGFGALEFGWGLGAMTGGVATGELLRRVRLAPLLMIALGILMFGHALLPFVPYLLAAVAMQALFGACRALTGIATQSSIMTTVPKHFMGRTQSAITIFSTLLQMTMSFALGWLAEQVSLPVAFFAVAAIYGLGAATAWRARTLGSAPVAAEA